MAMSEMDGGQSVEAVPTCISCNLPIDLANLSFEQRLVEDKEFCRICFEEILNDNNYDVRVPLLRMNSA